MIQLRFFFGLYLASMCVTHTSGTPDSLSLDPKPFDKMGLLIEEDVRKDTGRSRTQPCALWFYKGWVLAGRDYAKGSTIEWNDVWIPFWLRDSYVFLKWSRRKYFRRIVAPSRLPVELSESGNQYMFRESGMDSDDVYESSQMQRLLFSPAWDAPWECHDKLWNTEFRTVDNTITTNCSASSITCSTPSSLGPVLQATRPLAAGDPIFLPCDKNIDSHRAPSRDELEDFPIFKSMTKSMKKHGTCLDPSIIRIAPSTIADGGWGSFVTRAVAKGKALTSGPAIHLHRWELLAMAGTKSTSASNDGGEGDENIYYPDTLINYCYGHPKSNLLLLPNVHGVNTINHASSPERINVVFEWTKDSKSSPSPFFQKNSNKSTEELFGETEASQFTVRIVALRHITEGEELFVNYGSLWEQAWIRHRTGIPNNDDHSGGSNPAIPFRHEIGLPEGFFPTSWLNFEQQKGLKPRSGRHDSRLHLPELDVGRVERVSVIESSKGLKTNTCERSSINLNDCPVVVEKPTPLSEHGIFRVGLPNGLVDSMNDWATHRMGITDVLRSYVVRKDGHRSHGGDYESTDEGQRINGGAWWVNRVNQEWESNMHYITPDDDIAFGDFLHALSDAGFDKVLEGIGEHFGLSSLTFYFISLRAVSHVSDLYLHTDSDHKGVFNLLFPIHQVESGMRGLLRTHQEQHPELILADDNQQNKFAYHYEKDHGILLHEDGYHGTAPCDYRGRLDENTGYVSSNMRMIASLHFGDFSNAVFRRSFVKEWEGLAPEYPIQEDREEYLSSHTHWKAKDSSKTIKAPV
mmetsp:Transcript_19443/g.44443  ORF Transcript_19443/g.44443 Transcript_19443/m.44443 type:complete len:803 (+) Transcript_19443:88-2496(+)